MSQWNDKPNDWPWPDPIHRAYLTLMAQREQIIRAGMAPRSRKQLRETARRLAAKSNQG